MKPLIVFAMKEESQDVFSDYDVLHTGIGKINAAHRLTERVSQRRPDLIINMGTAGSRKFSGGTVVNPVKFMQRDMDVTALGFPLYQTPFSEDPLVIEHGRRIEAFPAGVCGTGDNFDASESAANFDVVDMEAYALALIAQRSEIPFLCLKYVSDGADGEAHRDWHAALHDTAEKLRAALKEAGL